MNRRELLKKAGRGTIALASLPTLAQALASPTWAGGQQSQRGDPQREVNFHFVANSQAGTIAGVSHRILMTGDGKVTPSNVVGGGSFNHFDFAPPVPPPKPILA